MNRLPLLLRTLACAACIIAVAAAGHALAQRKGPAVQQGLWELVVTVTGMSLMPKPPPGVQAPSKTLQACLTEAQADNPAQFVTQTFAPISPECHVGSIRQTGNRATWPLQCPAVKGQAAASGNGSFEFNRTTLEGTLRQTQPTSTDKPLEVTLGVTGKRIGDC